jgi:hypothetical protein
VELHQWPFSGVTVPLLTLLAGAPWPVYFGYMLQMMMLTAGCLMGITCLVLLIEATYKSLEDPASRSGLEK